MSDLFENYEEEFTELRNGVEARVTNIPNFSGTQRRSEVQAAEKDLRELEQILRKMNLSGRSNAKLVPKIREYEQEIARLRAAVRKADMQVSQTTDRSELFIGVKLDEVMSGSMSSRERLLRANDQLDSASADIDYANEMAQDAARLGEDTLVRLDQQSHQLHRMRDELSEIDTTLGKAKRVMRQIARRAIANKLILVVIALVLVAIICLVIYFKWVRPFESSDSSNTTTTGSSTSSASTTGAPLTSGGYVTTSLTTSHMTS